MMREMPLQRLILREFGASPGLRLFRNNVGIAVYPDGSRVTYGLCPGSSDLIGWQVVSIRGEQFARFVAIEVKGPNTRIAPNQRAFLRCVFEAGGRAIVARSLEDVQEGLNRAREA